MNLESQLVKGIAALDVALPKGSEIRLLQYLDLIRKWNRVYNLTAVHEPTEMLSRHLLDSLAVVPYISRATSIADVGSGAGLPGIPLALAKLSSRVVLFESNQKKTAFLKQVCIELGLKNVEVVTERVESYYPKNKFDTVISRAFSNLAGFVSMAGHLCEDDDKSGKIIAMKGERFKEELVQIPEQFVVDKTFSVIVPGLNGKRNFVFIKYK